MDSSPKKQFTRYVELLLCLPTFTLPAVFESLSHFADRIVFVVWHAWYCTDVVFIFCLLGSFGLKVFYFWLFCLLEHLH